MEAQVDRQWTHEELRAVLDAPVSFAGDKPPAECPEVLHEEWERQESLGGPSSCCEWHNADGRFDGLKDLLLQEIMDTVHRPLMVKLYALFSMLCSRLGRESVEHPIVLCLQDLSCNLRVAQVEAAMVASAEIDAMLPESKHSVVSSVAATCLANKQQGRCGGGECCRSPPQRRAMGRDRIVDGD